MGKHKAKRAGRARKQGVPRTDAGSISRAGAEKMEQVALNARQRIFHLGEQNAKDPLAETVLGRLYLTRGWDGKRLITGEQREAGEKLLEIHTGVARALHVPRGLSKTDSKPSFEWELAAGDEKDQQQADYTEWATRLVTKWELAKDWLQQVGRYEAVEVLRVAIADQPPKNLDALRRGLAYLAKRLGIMEYEEAEA